MTTTTAASKRSKQKRRRKPATAPATTQGVLDSTPFVSLRSPTDTDTVTAQSWLFADLDETALRLRLARQAQQTWAQLSVAQRCRRLQPLVDALVHRMDAIADLIGDENGKPRSEAIGQEVAACVGMARQLLYRAPRMLQPRTENSPWFLHRRATVTPRPLGAVVIISPWNIPLAIPLGQVLAALVAGNAVLLKPSEITPKTGALVVDLFGRCNLPTNLLTVLQGDGSVGAALVEAGPDKVFFTGSVATGRKVMAAAARHPIPVSLELGGIDALIVCEDADLELASSAAVWGGTFNHGQVCASVERVLVHASVYDAFMARVLDKVARIDPVSDLSRLTDPRQRAVYQRHLADARSRGLTFRCGGQWLSEQKLAPTVIDGADICAAQVWQQESFGPILAVAPFRDDNQAAALHDDTAFGLTASVFSTSPARAERLAGCLRAGLVAINDLGATLYAQGELPWGGVGASGFGRSHGLEGLLEFTRSHVVDRTRPGLPEFKRPWWYPYDPHQLALLRHFAALLGARRPLPAVRHLLGAGSALVRQLANHPRL